MKLPDGVKDAIFGPGFAMFLTDDGIVQVPTDQTEDEHQDTLRQLFKYHKVLDRELDKGVGELEAILDQHHPLSIIAGLWLVNSFANPETFKEYSHEGNDAFVEYIATLYLTKSFGVGSGGSTQPIDGEVFEDINNKVRELFNDTMAYYGTAGIDPDSPRRRDLFGRLRFTTLTRSLAVRYPAYQVHLKRTLQGILSPIDDLLLSIFGLGASEALRLCDAVERIAERRLNHHHLRAQEARENLSEAVKSYRQNNMVPSDRDQAFIERLAGLDKEELDGYLNWSLATWASTFLGPVLLFTADELAEEASVSADKARFFAQQMSLGFGQVDVRWFRRPSPTPPLHIRPIIRLRPEESLEAGHGRDEETFFCPVPRSVLWALRPNLERSLNPQDSDAHPNTNETAWARYDRARSNYLERRSMELLGKMLSYSTVHQSLRYEIANSDGTKTEAELDGMVQVGDAIFLVEAKAGAMTKAARRGAPDQIRKDLKALVSNAHSQALRARHFIEKNDEARFHLSDGTALCIPKERIDRTFLVNVTLEPISAFVTNMYELQEIGVVNTVHAEGAGRSTLGSSTTSGKEFPWSVNLYDLEVFADVIERPSELVHYLDRRLRLNEMRSVIAHGELDLLGRYLLQGLDFIEEFESRPGATVQLLTYTTPFDDYYSFKSGVRKTPVLAPAQPMPGPLSNILSEIECARPDSFLRMAEVILDIPRDWRLELAENIRKSRSVAAGKNRFSDASISDFDRGFGITYIAAPPNRSLEDLQARLLGYSRLKKYQLRLGRWLAIGGIAGEGRWVHACVYIDEPWHEDSGLEKMVEEYLPPMPDTDASRLKRGD